MLFKVNIMRVLLDIPTAVLQLTLI